MLDDKVSVFQNDLNYLALFGVVLKTCCYYINT